MLGKSGIEASFWFQVTPNIIEEIAPVESSYSAPTWSLLPILVQVPDLAGWVSSAVRAGKDHLCKKQEAEGWNTFH